MKLFSKRFQVIALHTLAGAFIGLLVLHPVTKVVYWFEFRHDLGAHGENLWNFLLSRFTSTFILEMLPMSLIFALTGSSSLRLSLFARTGDRLKQLAKVRHDGIEEPDLLLLSEFIASVDAAKITLIVHRVVHGGALLTTPCVINAGVEAEIEQLTALAPLHNPPALVWIRFARQLLGEQVAQVAVFDTAFYQSLPEVAATYALPRELCQQHGIRRYGFHGIAHQAMWQRWQSLSPSLKDGGQVISIQLGSGCSITAIDHGVPVDTSMGFSPLEGLVMSTRSGSLDPAIITYLQREAGMSAEEIELLLNKHSGLLGLSADSGDMRVLLESSSAEAKFAIDLYCYRVRKYIGAYLAVLGGVDAILFGGGVGENSWQVRTKILHSMEWLGLELNASVNKKTLGVEAAISTTQSKIKVWVIPVDEASVMAQQALMFR